MMSVTSTLSPRRSVRISSVRASARISRALEPPVTFHTLEWRTARSRFKLSTRQLKEDVLQRALAHAQVDDLDTGIPHGSGELDQDGRWVVGLQDERAVCLADR